jgi:CHAT domain-containing protein
MNACRSAGSGERYTELTSWASRFIKAGAGAFVGSLWEVRDGVAREFAQEFYDSLTKPRPDGTRCTLAEALQTARQAARGDPSDPTWLAIYGLRLPGSHGCLSWRRPS